MRMERSLDMASVTIIIPITQISFRGCDNSVEEFRNSHYNIRSWKVPEKNRTTDFVRPWKILVKHLPDENLQRTMGKICGY